MWNISILQIFGRRQSICYTVDSVSGFIAPVVTGALTSHVNIAQKHDTTHVNDKGDSE